MIRSGEVRAKLREVPFRPFRIVASSGRLFDIKQSGAMMVTNHSLIIGEFLPGCPDIAERACVVPLFDITELLPLPVDPYLN